MPKLSAKTFICGTARLITAKKTVMQKETAMTGAAICRAMTIIWKNRFRSRWSSNASPPTARATRFARTAAIHRQIHLEFETPAVAAHAALSASVLYAPEGFRCRFGLK